MKRPLAVTGFSYLAALAVALYIGRGCFDALGVIFLAAVVVSLAVKPLREMTFPVFVSLSALAAVVSLGIFTYSRVLPAAGFCGKNAQISAKLTDRPYSSYGRYYYPLRADNIISEDGRSLENVKILISSNKCFDMDLYDTINTDVEFGRNDNISYISKGTMLRGYIPFKAETNIIHESSKPFQYWLTSLKCAVVDEIKYLFPEKQAAVLSAVMTGDKAEIPDDIYDNFRKAGISHIIVLSGTHTTVMVSFVFALLMLLTGKNKRLSALLAALFVLLYMMTVGFTPSVTRAGIMQIIFLLGIAVSRRYDPINSLGLAVLIIILINPYAAADVSLLLSFSAVKSNDKVGLLLFTDKIERFIPPAKGVSHALRLIREVLAYEPEGTGTDITAALDYLGRVIRKRCVVFMISDFQGEGFKRQLGVLSKRHDVIAVSVGDKLELSLPDVGLLELEDLETGELATIDTGSKSVRRAYSLLGAERARQLQAMFRSLDVDQIDLQTGDDYAKKLVRFFRNRERRHR